MISIHALLAESDLFVALFSRGSTIFLSTLSLRRATVYLASQTFDIDISIHALLAESDQFWGCSPSPRSDFYPRSPCGERLEVFSNMTREPTISIHALLAESDAVSLFFLTSLLYFYPRSPCGERQLPATEPPRVLRFLSTLSLRRATRFGRPIDVQLVISIHALLAESDILGRGVVA